jgi:hypothetical protein
MVGLPCLVSQFAMLHIAGWTWAVFTLVYLESCTWPVAIFTMDQRKKQSVCIKICANLMKTVTETLTMIQQAFGCQISSRTSNCCTNSRVHLSVLTSDRSQHYWGGGNWLWDMPKGSDIGIQNIVDQCRRLYSSCGSVKHWYMVELPCVVSQCAKLHLAGWTWALHQSGIFGYHVVYSNCRVAATVHTTGTWCVWVHNCKYPV